LIGGDIEQGCNGVGELMQAHEEKKTKYNQWAKAIFLGLGYK
jgi:hypothetical protein